MGNKRKKKGVICAPSDVDSDCHSSDNQAAPTPKKRDMDPSVDAQDQPWSTLPSDLCIPSTSELLGDGELSLSPCPSSGNLDDLVPAQQNAQTTERHNFTGFRIQPHATMNSPTVSFVDSHSPILSETRAQPSNKTVIIMQPVADEGSVKKFFGNDIGLAKALSLSPFGMAGIEKTAKNLQRKLLIITMKEAILDPSYLLDVTKLGNWQVKCRLPINQTQSVGVIGPFGEDTNGEELLECLVSDGYSVLSADRIVKGKSNIQTSMFKIVFLASSLPAYVYVGYQRFPVRAFVGQPWQCFRCQRFGHSAMHCKSAPRCVVCSGPHNTKDCPKPEMPKCCNCSGNHTANYGGCPFIKEARLVEKTRVEHRLSYRDAMMHVKKSVTLNSTNPALTPLRVTSSASTNLNSMKSSNSICSCGNRPIGTTTISIATQTSSGDYAPTLQNVSVQQFIKLLTKILSLNLNKDGVSLDFISKLTTEEFNLDDTKSNVPPSVTAIDNVLYCQNKTNSSSPQLLTDDLPTSLTSTVPDATVEPSPVIGRQYFHGKARKPTNLNSPSSTRGKSHPARYKNVVSKPPNKNTLKETK
jgi:hypothetical protein